MVNKFQVEHSEKAPWCLQNECELLMRVGDEVWAHLGEKSRRNPVP